MLASQNGHSGVFQELLASGAQVDLQSKSGGSALMSASVRYGEIV